VLTGFEEKLDHGALKTLKVFINLMILKIKILIMKFREFKLGEGFSKLLLRSSKEAGAIVPERFALGHYQATYAGLNLFRASVFIKDLRGL